MGIEHKPFDVEHGEVATEVRQAIDDVLLQLSKRFSFLEDWDTRRFIADAVHTAVANALKEKLKTKNFDLAVLEEVLASLLEKFGTRIMKDIEEQHIDMAGIIGRRSGELTDEIRMVAHRVLEEILSLKREERATQEEMRKTRDTIQALEYMRNRL